MYPGTKELVLAFLLLTTQEVFAQPIRSYPEYFTFYRPLSPAMPAGSPLASKAIIQIQGEYSATAFLVRTFRKDHKVCMVLAAHQINDLYPSPFFYLTGRSVAFNASIAMNFYGEHVIYPDGKVYMRTLPGQSIGFLDHPELVGYHFDLPAYKDIALLLVDRRTLPVDSYAELGYDLSDVWVLSDSYYMIAHPLKRPQTISTFLSVDISDHSVTTTANLPNAQSVGASGGPLIQYSTVTTGCYAKGVQSQIVVPYNFIDDPIRGQVIVGTNLRFTKINVLANDIRDHCWAKEDSSAIATSRSYRESVMVGNAAAIVPFTQDQTITSASAISSSSAAFSQLTAAGTQLTYLKAAVCNISGFALPVTYPGSSNPWVVTIAGKEINVAADFSYTPVGDAELNLASVEIPSLPAAMRQPSRTAISTQPDDGSPGFKVYPNPSADGVFNISFPPGDVAYDVMVNATDGRQVYAEKGVSGPSYRFDLSAMAQGAYLLNIYVHGRGQSLVQKKIIY